jgi:DNA-binding winged helix-turn-helix (wHTH) protein
MRVRFGDCVFDSETRELLRVGRAARVSPRAFQLLQVLLEKRPKAVSKDELHAVLWPKTFVADTTLTGLVKELRAAIGDDARAPRFIRTIPAFGYAFSGEARDVRRPVRVGYFCRVIGPDSQAGLADGDNILGRGPESVLWIDEETVSRRHARIRVERESAVLEDLSSRNGTFLGKRRVDAQAVLRDGDEIRLGNLSLRFRASGSPESTRSASRGREKAGRTSS